MVSLYKSLQGVHGCTADKTFRYWWWLNEGPSNPTDVYDYHLEKYGKDVVYDDFIQNFTASAWDPKEWVDLFADAGANYFVQVSKHHEGYALFDLPENVTKRTSVALTPHRNLVQVSQQISTIISDQLIDSLLSSGVVRCLEKVSATPSPCCLLLVARMVSP